MSEPDEPTFDDLMAECQAIELEKRLTLRAISELLRHLDYQKHRNPATQRAIDLCIMAACARAKRILRSDLKGNSS